MVWLVVVLAEVVLVDDEVEDVPFTHNCGVAMQSIVVVVTDDVLVVAIVVLVVGPIVMVVGPAVVETVDCTAIVDVTELFPKLNGPPLYAFE